MKKLVATVIAALVIAGMVFSNRQEAARQEELYRGVKRLDDNPLFPVKDLKTGKCGYIDRNGKIVIDPAFDHAGDFMQPGLAYVHMYGGGYPNGLIDRQGNIRFPVQSTYLNYDNKSNTIITGVSVGYSANSRIWYDEYRLGYYKLDGTVILPAEYSYLSEVVNGWACVKKTAVGILSMKPAMSLKNWMKI